MAQVKLRRAARPPSTGARRDARSRRKPKKPWRIFIWFGVLKGATSRLVIKLFLAFSFASAAFPAATQALEERITVWAEQAVDTSRIQSIMTIPVVSSLLARISTSGVGVSQREHRVSASHSKASSSKQQTKSVKNPFW